MKPATTVGCRVPVFCVPEHGARLRYRDEQGRVHPWPDRRGRWTPEYICRACALVYPDCMEYDWSGIGDWWWLAARRSSDTAGDEAPRQDSTHKGWT